MPNECGFKLANANGKLLVLTLATNLLTVKPSAARAEAAAAPAKYLLDPMDFPTEDKAENNQATFDEMD